MVTASDSSANTVPGERTGLGVLSFGVPLKKAGAAVREWKKKRRKKRYRSRKNGEKAVQKKNEPKKNSCEEKGQEKPLQIEEKTRTAAKEQKIDRKTDETREIEDSCAGAKDRNKDSRTKTAGKGKSL